MKVDFYNRLTNKINTLIRKSTFDSEFSFLFFKSMNRDFINFLKDNNYSFVNDNKKHFYSGVAISFEKYQILYVKDRLNTSTSKMFLNDGESIIEIDNNIEKIDRDGELIEKNKSVVYVNGRRSNEIISVYNKNIFSNEMIYESVVSAADGFDLDNNQDAEKIEISYFLGTAMNGKYNNVIIGNSVICDYVWLANSKVNYILDFFDNFDLKNNKVKVK